MLRRLWFILKAIATLTVLALLIGPQWPAFGDETYRIETIVGGRVFDFPTWLAEAAIAKAAADVTESHKFIDAEEQVALVRGYFDLLAIILQQERELQAALAAADPQPEAINVLQGDIAAGRAELAPLQPLVESILQDQVAAVLLDEGFGIGGRIWPPVRMRLTPLPTLLVVSPRAEIRQIHAVPLSGGLTAAERAEIEEGVADQLKAAGYVTDIGGLGVYPTMIIETANLPFLFDVIAHEWAHNWFNQYPIGLNYGASGEIRSINESAAGLVGQEVSAAVLERFYPDLAPPPPPLAPSSAASEPPLEPDDPPEVVPPPFDFRAEMRETRVQVDELLAAGQIEAAEMYMEARRLVFVENGYPLRVLNQAYFAFHGAYADQPGAAGGSPIGPGIRELRQRFPSLRQFMLALRFVTTLEELEEMIEKS